MYTFKMFQDYLKQVKTYDFQTLKAQCPSMTTDEWFCFLIEFIQLKISTKSESIKSVFKCFRYMNNPENTKEIEDYVCIQKSLVKLEKEIAKQVENTPNLKWQNFLSIVTSNIELTKVQINLIQKQYLKHEEKIKDLYDFAIYMIFKVRDIHYVRELIKTFPEIIHFKNSNQQTLLDVLMEKYFRVLKKCDNDYLLLYYDKVINLIFENTQEEVKTMEKKLLEQFSSFLEEILTLPYPLEKQDKIKNFIERTISTIEKQEFCCTKEKLCNLYTISFTNYPLEEKTWNKKTPVEDLRNELVISIDEASTHFRDDAFSFKKLSNGGYQLGIYTPDVADRISLNSPLDKQARKIGSNIYGIPYRVTIFPEEVIAKNFSLDCNTERLAIGCFFTFNDNMELISSPTIKRVWIKPHYNMNPRQVSYLLTREKNRGKRKDVYKMIHQFVAFLENSENVALLNDWNGYYDVAFSKKLVDRIEEGNSKEDIFKIYYSYAHQIVKFLKILAGSSVAETIQSQGLPFLYQINPRNVEDSITKKAPKNSREVACYMKNATILPHYSTESLEHKRFGSSCYTRWTTPIREYASLVSERLIIRYLIDQRIGTDKELVSLEKYLQNLCKELNLRNLLNEEFALNYRQMSRKKIIKKR